MAYTQLIVEGFDTDSEVQHVRARLTPPCGKSARSEAEAITKEQMIMINNNEISHPDSTWTLDRLEKYALSRMQELCGFGRKTLQQTWLFGKALSYIRDAKKGENWLDWVDSQPFSRSTASNAIKLASRISFDDLELCDGMTVSDVKVELNIIKKPPVTKRLNPTHAETATVADRQSSRKASDSKLSKNPFLSLYDGNGQNDEQPATGTLVEAPEVSAALQQDTPEHAAAAKTETPAQNITPVTAMEYLHRINMKLGDLERDLKGSQPDEHLVRLIDQAISTLQRIRAAAATETDAA